MRGSELTLSPSNRPPFADVSAPPLRSSSLQTLKQRPQLVSNIVNLFPTISHMAQTPNGRVMWPLFSSVAALPVGLATGALGYLPARPLTKVVSLLAAQSGHPAEVTTGLVSSPATVRAALSMAAEEMKRVTSLDNELLASFGGRMWWYWARDGLDGWVSESSVEEIESVLDEAGHAKAQRQRCGEGMKHAFCLREGESLLDSKSGRSVLASRADFLSRSALDRSRRVAREEGR